MKKRNKILWLVFLILVLGVIIFLVIRENKENQESQESQENQENQESQESQENKGNKAIAYYKTSQGEYKEIVNYKGLIINPDCMDGGGTDYYINEKELPGNLYEEKTPGEYDKNDFLENKSIAEVGIDSCNDIYEYKLKNESSSIPEIIARGNYKTEQEFTAAAKTKKDSFNNYLADYNKKCDNCLLRIMTGFGVTPDAIRYSTGKFLYVCESKPVTSEIGREIFPTSFKYNNLFFLGELFTAADCGQNRIDEIYGLNSNYSLGSRIVLKKQATPDLLGVLKDIGYKCSSSDTEDKCLEWTLSDTIKINNLLKLQPYFMNIKSDDCVNCG